MHATRSLGDFPSEILYQIMDQVFLESQPTREARNTVYRRIRLHSLIVNNPQDSFRRNVSRPLLDLSPENYTNVLSALSRVSRRFYNLTLRYRLLCLDLASPRSDEALLRRPPEVRALVIDPQHARLALAAASRLPNLHSLFLDNVEPEQCLLNLRSLREFSFSARPRWFEAADLLALLALLPNMKTMYLGNLQCRSMPASLSLQRQLGRSPLAELHFEGQCIVGRRVVSGLARLPRALEGFSLIIREHLDMDGPCLSSILKEHSASLRTLCIRADRQGAGRFGSIGSLHSFAVLQELSINIEILLGHYHSPRQRPKLCTILPPSLRKLRLDVTAPWFVVVACQVVELAVSVHSAASTAFSSLESVEMEYTTGVATDPDDDDSLLLSMLYGAANISVDVVDTVVDTQGHFGRLVRASFRQQHMSQVDGSSARDEEKASSLKESLTGITTCFLCQPDIYSTTTSLLEKDLE